MGGPGASRCESVSGVDCSRLTTAWGRTVRTELRQGGRDRAVRGALWLCGVMRGDERQLDVLVEWEGEDSDGDLRLDSQAAPATGGLRSDF